MARQSIITAATKLGQGNIFTSVCLSTGGRGVCLSACWDTHPPWEQTPSPEQTPLGADPPGADTPQEQPPPPEQAPPGSRLQHMVNERPVRILLECILVWQIVCRKLCGNERNWTKRDWRPTWEILDPPLLIRHGRYGSAPGLM